MRIIYCSWNKLQIFSLRFPQNLLHIEETNIIRELAEKMKQRQKNKINM